MSEEELFGRVKFGADIEGEHPAKQKNAKSKYFRTNNLANDETSTNGVVCATMGVGRSFPGGGNSVFFLGEPKVVKFRISNSKLRDKHLSTEKVLEKCTISKYGSPSPPSDGHVFNVAQCRLLDVSFDGSSFSNSRLLGTKRRSQSAESFKDGGIVHKKKTLYGTQTIFWIKAYGFATFSARNNSLARNVHGTTYTHVIAPCNQGRRKCGARRRLFPPCPFIRGAASCQGAHKPLHNNPRAGRLAIASGYVTFYQINKGFVNTLFFH